MRTSLAFAPALLLGVAFGSLAAVAQEVGTAGAVNPASTGTPPSRPTRVLELGSRVVHKERINTTAGGNVQLVFVDKTTMSIGPNSDIVIDEFVYDPNAGTGRMAASMAKGVLRFVGGNTSHSGGAQIKTPSATLGIRGGVATVEVSPCAAGRSVGADCGTKVISHFGVLSIQTAAGTEIIRRPGFVVKIPGAGAAPTAPRRVTQAEVNQTNRQVSSKPGQTGGKGNVSQAVIARADTVGPALSQIGTAVVSEQRQNLARQDNRAQSLGLAVAPTDPTTPTQIQQFASNVNQQVTTQVQQQQFQQAQPIPVTPTPGSDGNQPNGGVSPPPPPTSTASPQAFALNYNGGSAAFLPAAIASSPNLSNSAILGYADGNAGSSGRTNVNRVMQGGLSISGEGSNQRSSIYLLTGQTFLAANGTPAFDGGFTATGVTSSNRLLARASGGAAGSGSDVVTNSNNVTTALNFQSGTVDPATGNVTGGNATLVTNPGRQMTNYQYSASAAQVVTPGNLGTNRPDLTSVPVSSFGGSVGGIVTTVNNTTGATTAPASLSGLFDLAFKSTSSQFGTTIGVNAASSDPNGMSSAYLDFGKAVDSFYSRPESVDGRGTYVDYDNFGAREAVASDGSYTSTVNGSAVTDHKALFVTADTVNAKSYFPNVNFCQCEYTRWGFWSSETSRTNASGQSLTDLIHLGTWVFGVPAEASQIPSSGVATYTGHAIATFQSGNSQYIAAGNFQNVVNFGTGTGNVTVSNLDNRSYAGSVTVGTASNGIYGTIPQTGGAAQMSLDGLLYRGAIGPVGEMGGNLTITGPNYLGSGIFAGATRSIGTAP